MKIHIPEDCTQINVLVSGGVDSTILLFLLLQENAGRVPVKTFTFAPRNNLLGDVSLNTVAKILPWLEARFQTNIPHMIIKRTSYIRRAVEDISLIEDGYVYTGCNKVMYDEFTPTIYIPNDTPPVRGDAFGVVHLRPFINRDKIEIMHEFVMHDIIELLHLTKSCGISEVPCRGCYFCMERQWAAAYLGITDI
jgi:7-cyano-7-deazaguanine synthase in queuosine biosynthesis